MEKVFCTNGVQVIKEVICVNGGKETKLILDFRKSTYTIIVSVYIDSQVLGELHIKERKSFIDFRMSLSGLSCSNESRVVGTKNRDRWEKEFKYFKYFPRYDVIEEKISFYTLISIVELYFPTNWMLLLP